MNPTLAGLLGPEATYEGDLVFQGRVRIDGAFAGSITSDDFLEIGPTGHVEGDIDVAQVLIAGTVRGQLRVRERCTILATGTVEGHLRTPWLDVRPGARLKADVVVDHDASEGAE